MSVAPNAGVVDLDTFLPPTGAVDGVQGQVPKPLAGQAGYVLTGDGWASAGSVGLVGYQGTWNALTNTPTLTSSVGVQGYYYVVDVAGTTNLNGITDWQVGDWAIFNGSIWQKVDNTDSYDPTNVAITGGTINGTTVGATTPATGVFTTLTAQTEVLKGTGQNLLTNSQAFAGANWANSTNVTLTQNATTAPDSTNTATKIAATSTTAEAIARFAFTPSFGATYTVSVFAKKDTTNFFRIRNLISSGGGSAGNVWFNLDAGTVGTIQSGQSATITSAGSGWYRCTVTCVSSTTSSANFIDFGTANANGSQLSTAGDSFFAWGAQLELGSTANTYIPTTTTAVYGTPTLSFSGVSTIGLESNGSLFVQPAGTGALQAQATTSSAVGGNARGANAVDWQTARGAASQVASGAVSFIGAGQNNTSSSYGTVVCGGANSSATGANTFVGAGTGLTASGPYATAVGGAFNTSAGQFNFIGGGQSNSGTALSAVTTQSATMNGTTAVTLSGSNANIKVGQYISGTSIGFGTYVAAISGTSLTLSQVASGSSTSTLSFFTPHGVVVGGGNNQATGSYSFIGGGGDAGTAGNRNVASGDYAVVAGGRTNTASGVASFIGGGGFDGTSVLGNTAAGSFSCLVGGAGNSAGGFGAFVGGGAFNSASGQYSATICGSSNSASGTGSSVLSGYSGVARSIVGNTIFAGSVNPINTTQGVSQAGLLILGRQTTDATATVLCSNSSAASTTNQVILPNNSAYYFKGSVIANVTGAANGASWSFEGAIMRGANAASTVLMGTPAINRVAATAGATAWAIALTADTTNGGLAVTVTGAASTTIRWVCKAETTEVTY